MPLQINILSQWNGHGIALYALFPKTLHDAWKQVCRGYGRPKQPGSSRKRGSAWPTGRRSLARTEYASLGFRGLGV